MFRVAVRKVPSPTAASRIASSAEVALRRQQIMVAAATRRCMSVFTLSDNDAVEKFRTINHKSLLYFTATWCPPCKQIKPVYEKLAHEYGNHDGPEEKVDGGIAFGKVDVDDNADAAMEFQISSVPTFVAFDGEDPVDRFSGADVPRLEEMVKKLAET